MEEYRGSVVIGPTAHDGDRPVHVGVLGQMFVDAERQTWIFSSIPAAEQDMVATFRVHGDGASAADVVRVGTALALYAEPEIGDIGGAILEHLGTEELYDVAITPEIAREARAITDWSLTCDILGADDLEPLAAALAQGYWTTRLATLGLTRTDAAERTGSKG